MTHCCFQAKVRFKWEQHGSTAMSRFHPTWVGGGGGRAVPVLARVNTARDDTVAIVNNSASQPIWIGVAIHISLSPDFHRGH